MTKLGSNDDFKNDDNDDGDDDSDDDGQSAGKTVSKQHSKCESSNHRMRQCSSWLQGAILIMIMIIMAV